MLLAAGLTVGCASWTMPVTRNVLDVFPSREGPPKRRGRLLVHFAQPIDDHVTRKTMALSFLMPLFRFYTGKVLHPLLIHGLANEFPSVREGQPPPDGDASYDYLVVFDRFASRVSGVMTYRARVSFTCEVRDPSGNTLARKEVAAHGTSGSEFGTTYAWQMEKALGRAIERAARDAIGFVGRSIDKQGGTE